MSLLVSYLNEKDENKFYFHLNYRALVVFFNTNGFSQKQYDGDIKETVIQLQSLIDASGANFLIGNNRSILIIKKRRIIIMRRFFIALIESSQST